MQQLLSNATKYWGKSLEQWKFALLLFIYFKEAKFA